MCISNRKTILKFSYPSNLKSCTLAIHFIYVKREPHWCCLTPLSTIFQLFNGGQFFGGGPGENNDLSQVTDKLYHIMLCTSPWSRFELTTSVVIGTDCRGSCQSNYHTITATAAPDPHWKWSEWSKVLEFEMKMWIHVTQQKDTMYTCQPLTPTIFVLCGYIVYI